VLSNIYDVVIVGAGPAGSAAAITLGRTGHRVLLLDRAILPRDKPCGDLIGARAMRAAVRLGVGQTALNAYRRITGAIITAGNGPLDLSPGSPRGRQFLAGSDARVVPRMVFDDLLVQSAVRAGVELGQATVRAVGPWSEGTRLVCADGPAGPVTVAGRAVVIAGGYGCRVAPDVAPRPEEEDLSPRGIAMRGYFRDVTCPPERIIFSLDRWLLPGYGWIFPLPDGRANVGVGTLVGSGGDERGGLHLRELWRRFTGDAQSPAAGWLAGAVPDDPPRAWPLDLGPRRRRLVADGLAVIGEAAGLVGPLTGAGIAFALESGDMAGRTLAAALTDGDLSRERLHPYSAWVRRRTGPWLRAELLAQRFLSDPVRVERLFAAIRPLPPTGTLGARLLLHLG
jgi:geranylgeranyl reductase family protein